MGKKRQSKGEKYEHVLKLMQSKGGRLELTDPDLIALLGAGLMYRAAVYFSYIRRHSLLEVKAIRDGRHVVAYELVRANPDTEEAPIWQNSKYLQKKEKADDGTVTTA